MVRKDRSPQPERPLPPPGPRARPEGARGSLEADAVASCTRSSPQAPVYHLGFPTRVAPACGRHLATAIPGVYMSPYEDLMRRPP